MTTPPGDDPSGIDPRVEQVPLEATRDGYIAAPVAHRPCRSIECLECARVSVPPVRVMLPRDWVL